MANRYWVGGTGDWADTAKWSATSGGSGGASVPTSVDNAYFDGASDAGAAFTVTISATASCRDFIVGDGVAVTALDQQMTFAGSASLTVYGSWYNPATNYVRTFARGITFAATTTGHTITTNGVVITASAQDLIFDGVGGEWTLGSALQQGTAPSGGGSITLNAGTFRTGGYNVVCNFFGADNTSTTKAIYLGASTFTCYNNNFQAGFNGDANATSLTLDAGTSTIVANTFNVGRAVKAFTLYNAKQLNTGNFGVTLAGNFNIANDLEYTLAGTPGVGSLRLGFTSFSIGGTFILQQANTAPTNRVRVSTITLGAPCTLTCNAITIGDGVDFRDIILAGAAAPFNASTKSTGNLGGNTGITFPAAKTVYWNLAGNNNWSANAWATTPTGTPAAANFPLAQDTAVVTEAGAAGTIIINAGWDVGTLTFDGAFGPRTSDVTLNVSNGMFFYGDLKLSSGVILAGTGTVVFTGRKTQTLTSAAKTILGDVLLDSPGGTLVLGDNVTQSANRTFTFAQGALDLNGFILNVGIFSSTNPTTRSIAFGSSKIQISGNGSSTAGTTVLNVSQLVGYSYTGTGLFELVYQGSGFTRLIVGPSGNVTAANAPNISIIGGTDNIAFFAGGSRCIFNSLTFQSGFAGAVGPLSSDGNNNKGVALFGNFTYLPATFNRSLIDDNVFPLLEFLSPSGTQVLTTNASIDGKVAKSDAGTLRFDSALVMSARRFTHTQGTVNLNGRALTCFNWSSSNSNVRSLLFGTGQIVLTGTGTVWDATTATNYSIAPDAGKISMSNSTDTARTFAGGGILTYPEVEIGGDSGTATTTITGGNGFSKLTNTKLVAYTVVFPNVETRVASWNLNGSAGNLITLSRTGGSGTFTIRYVGGAFALAQYLSISNSNALPVRGLYAIYSVNGGGNTGWTFGAPEFGKFLSYFLAD